MGFQARRCLISNVDEVETSYIRKEIFFQLLNGAILRKFPISASISTEASFKLGFDPISLRSNITKQFFMFKEFEKPYKALLWTCIFDN
jgi:hypothetical protein